MEEARAFVEKAFEKLRVRRGYSDRANQYQLALLLFDLIEQGTPSAIEAPTGIGKSLACLVPAIAHALTGKKVVIATYTNILAEQYSSKDLPLALSLFDEVLAPPPAFLIGRQRYLCLTSLREATEGRKPLVPVPFDGPRMCVAEAKVGQEKEVKQLFSRRGLTQQKVNQLWSASAAPAACPARLCPDYDACFYYRAREEALRSNLVITNHSVVIQDALMKNHDPEAEAEKEQNGMLGTPDYIILDEAHDFPQAAMNGLEFVLDSKRLDLVAAMAKRVEVHLAAFSAGFTKEHQRTEGAKFIEVMVQSAKIELDLLAPSIGHGMVLASDPEEWIQHPSLQERVAPSVTDATVKLAESIQSTCERYASEVENAIRAWELAGACTEQSAQKLEATIRNHLLAIKETGAGVHAALFPRPGNLGWVAEEPVGFGQLSAAVRCDPIDLAPQLDHLLWQKVPVTCLSATLAIDGAFDFFEGLSGFKAQFEEILPSPFDYSFQAGLYLPPPGTIPDPSQSRGDGQDVYYSAIAKEVQGIIRAMEGRTLVLFHSRKEMEEVHKRLRLPDQFPVLIQPKGSAAIIGQAFKESVQSSLFAVRSFWTGFDAPGDTLSCVVLTRIPFEVPIIPSQIARMIMLAHQGKDPFQHHSLSQAKMLLRQGAGRLIRTETDRGLICLLDPRVHTKKYGDSMVENLPSGMKRLASPQDWG